MTSLSAPPAAWSGRFPVLLSLLGVAALAWIYLWIDAARMAAMPMGMGMADNLWSAGSLTMLFAMWAIMMVGMMLPSAAPAILLYAGMVKKNAETGSAVAPAWLFAAGYLAVWTTFSVAATLLQAALQSAMLVTPMMASNSAWLSGILLILAGIYQWLPIKDTCLQKCRAPLSYFLFSWRPGHWGAFRMGAGHGAYCVGCCWALMLLLFTAGVMNLLWIAVIAGFVLAEKLVPAGAWFGRIAGVAMVMAGLFLIASGVLANL